MNPVDRSAHTAIGVALASGPTDGPLGPPLPARIANRYDVRSLVGAGGMGSVYRVHDRELDEEVALKFLKREVLRQPGVLERFRAEVRLARRVTHENVARTFDIGEHGAERFLTMEFVAGESLTTRLRREGVLSPAAAAALGVALASGLGAAHRAGVVHRDLKPDNVLIAETGRVVITDFGIARPAGVAAQAGAPQMFGTAGYMAPEQLMGAADIDGRADLYALGVVLFEALTGRVAWPGDSFMDIAMPRLLEPPPDPRHTNPKVPDALADVVMRLMAQRREDRFPDADAVVHALGALLPTLPAALPTGPVPIVPAAARAARAAPLPDACDRTIAVLPLANAGPREDDALADELTDEIIDGLSLVRGLRVRPRRLVARAADIDELQALGRALDAQVIVEGTLRRREGLLRLTARLISVQDDLQLWAERYEVEARQALNLPEEVVRAATRVLACECAHDERATLPVSAVDLFLRARRLLRERWAGFGDLGEVVHLFEQGLALAPDDLRLVAGYAMAIARAWNFAALNRDAPPDATRARALVEQALDATPLRPEPWLALASLRSVESDWEGAVRALRRTLHLSPGLDLAQEMLAAIEVEVGCDDEGIARYERVRVDPDDPGAPLYHTALRHALHARWSVFDRIVTTPIDEAFDVWRGLLIARTNLYRGRAAHPTPPDDPSRGPSRASARDPQVALTRLLDATLRDRALPASFAELREVSESARQGSRLRPLLFQVQAELLAYVGHLDEALEAITAAVASQLFDLVWLERCPLLDPLRTRPEMALLGAEVAARCAPIRAALRAPLAALPR